MRWKECLDGLGTWKGKNFVQKLGQFVAGIFDFEAAGAVEVELT